MRFVIALLTLLLCGVASASPVPLERIFGYEVWDHPQTTRPKGNIIEQWFSLEQKYRTQEEIVFFGEQQLSCIKRASSLKPAEQLIKVQGCFTGRHICYSSDIETYGEKNYWATPGESWTPTLFTWGKCGDCEEFAGGKYFALRWLGWDPKDLRVLILHDRDFGPHAVLLAWLGGHWMVLDNLFSRVYPGEDPKVKDRYRTLFSVNETGWWFNPIKPKSQPVFASSTN